MYAKLDFDRTMTLPPVHATDTQLPVDLIECCVEEAQMRKLLRTTIGYC
jgi:hypothetical protein